MSPTVAATALPPQAGISAIERQILLLETLQSLLAGAMRSLSGGEAQPLLEMSRQISFTAQELTALSLQLGRLPASPDLQQRRSKLLAELSQQRAFCRAMLRRWRRSIALRQQLQLVASDGSPYTDSLTQWS